MLKALILIAAHLCCQAYGSKLPNIVFVLADDLGYADIGYHGGAGQGIRTPTLDKLAHEGVRLENYYVQPICTPTRGTLLSGNHVINVFPAFFPMLSDKEAISFAQLSCRITDLGT